MVEEIKEQAENSSISKERKSKETEPKKNNKSGGKKSKHKEETNDQAEIAECVLRKRIKNKKRKNYSKEEVKEIYDSVKEPKSKFPTYLALIYPNKVHFKPKKKGKKIAPIDFKNIEQIIRVPGDLSSFLLHVPKSGESKQFTGLFTWVKLESAEKLELGVKKFYKKKESEAAGGTFQNSTPKRNYPSEPTRPSQPTTSPSEETSDTGSPTALVAQSMNSRGRTSDSGLVSPHCLKQTFTFYIPSRTYKRRTTENVISSLRDSYELDYSSSTYSDFEDNDYICRDKDSVFYGERMSPNSQYVDRLLRATARTQYETAFYD